VIGEERSGVFLSYARKDGEDFAATLRERLRTQAPDIVIKQDRISQTAGSQSPLPPLSNSSSRSISYK